MRLRENSRSASAVATFLPRMSCATRLSFCGLIRSMRATAMASLSESARSRFFLLMKGAPASRCAAGRRCRRRRRRRGTRRTGALGLAIRRMAVERARRRELAELVADHFLGDDHRDVLLPVIDPEGEPDELRQNGRAPRPDADHLVASRLSRGIRLLEQIAVDERTFPNRTRHDRSYLFFFRAWRLTMMNLAVRLFLRVFMPLVGLPQGVTGCRPPRVRPPSGWSTGFMVSPRTWPRRPIQRLRPALPIEMFMLSGLDTAPTVAMQRPCTRRCSPEFKRKITYSPSRPTICA